MVERFVFSLHRTIPQVRLEKYRGSSGDDLQMLTNYFWNVALCEALYPSLHAVELGLRNSIHMTLTNHYGTEEWWDILYPRIPGEYIIHCEQHKKVVEKRKYFEEKSKELPPSQLVTELSFTWWVIMLSGDHDLRIWRDNKYSLLDQVFPFRAETSLGDIWACFNRIRLLRNRVMHHERIFDRSDLLEDYDGIYQALWWLKPDLRRSINAFDRFPEVYDLGWGRVYDKLHAIAGGP